MANQCAYIPGIKNNKGEIVDSRLFDSLLSFFNKNRAEAKKHYFIATNSEFLEAFKDSITLDSNGEVTLESYIKAAELDANGSKFIGFLNKVIGSGDYDVDTAISKAQAFSDSEYKNDYIASLVWTNEGKVHIEVVKKDAQSEANLREFYKQKNLINRIIEALNRAGVNVDFLIDNANSVNGRYSTKNAEKTHNGLYSLITIFSSSNVAETLAEEAGHFVYASMQKDILVNRLSQALTKEVISELFGNELDILDENDKVIEAAGRLIGQALINKSKNKLTGLLNRIVLNAKKYYAKLTKNEVKQLLIDAELTADKMAENFLSPNFTGSIDTALDQKITLFSQKSTSETKAFAEVKAEMEYYRDRMKAINGWCRINYDKRVNKALSKAVSKLKTVEFEEGLKYYSTIGISDSLSLLINDYTRIINNLDKIDLKSKEIDPSYIDYVK